MTPTEAAADLRLVHQLLIQGQPLPPSLRVWLANAIDQRLRSHKKSLDQLLEIASRAGGALTACSKIPERDKLIRQMALAIPEKTVTRKARQFAARVRNHRSVPDPTLTKIENEHGRLPSTARRIFSIMKNAPSQQRSLETVDLSMCWNR